MQTRELLRVPHKNKVLNVSYPAFGPDTYEKNLENIQKHYFHSEELPNIYFTEPTTSESLSVAVYNFQNPKDIAFPRVLDEGKLQLGRVVLTSEGVFANPPKNNLGNPITEERKLKSYLKDAKKVNGIYLGKDDFGFASYETFTRNLQDHNDFVLGGLARILEYTEEKVANKFRFMASSNTCKEGFLVGFPKEVTSPVSTVLNLNIGFISFSCACIITTDEYKINEEKSKGYLFGKLNSTKKCVRPGHMS
ncbi:MAG: hypothetical protein WC595_06590 [Candidatus Nanoarchaeia archaeon]